MAMITAQGRVRNGNGGTPNFLYRKDSIGRRIMREMHDTGDAMIDSSIPFEKDIAIELIRIGVARKTRVLGPYWFISPCVKIKHEPSPFKYAKKKKKH